MMHWDPTVTAGEVLQGVIFVTAVVAAYIRLRERLLTIEVTLKTQLEPLWRQYEDRQLDDRRTPFARRAEDRARTRFEYGDTGE